MSVTSNEAHESYLAFNVWISTAIKEHVGCLGATFVATPHKSCPAGLHKINTSTSIIIIIIIIIIITHFNADIRTALSSTLAAAGSFHNHSRHRRVGRTLISAKELSVSCARLIAGWMIIMWVSCPLSISQHGQLSHPSLRGR